MRIRWTAAARFDLVRLREFLAPANLLRHNPRLGARAEAFAPREVRRLFVDDYELRYEIQSDVIIVVRLWHTREDR
jgi:plasmid stabilization system protein ParE